MKHVFNKGKDENRPTFLLLHGTGGDEQDLLPLASMIDDAASILSVRGNVNENGMSRFFRRLAEGVFDEEDLVYRTKELYNFLDIAAEDHEFDRNNLIAVGYSNGANIAGSLLFHYQNVFKGAILLHPMIPLRGKELPELYSTRIFIGAGSNDPICRPEETKELADMLEAAGAKVNLHWDNQGHQLTQSEIHGTVNWYQRNFS